MLSVEHNISLATARNWQRLNVASQNKLKTRANKTRSDKNIIPLEYFSYKENIALITDLINFIQSNHYAIDSVLYSLSINLLNKKNILQKQYVKQVLQDYYQQFNAKKIEILIKYSLPKQEKDILGLIYQSLLGEGEKNLMGSYYTPHDIAYNMIKDFDLSSDKTFFDPSCGSGAYFLALNAINPMKLFGIDKDAHAVFIAKINLLLKYNELDFIPQIFCIDYLNDNNDLFSNNNLSNMKFDYIATNPPWGANSKYHSEYISSNETFSLFFVKAFSQLKENGKIHFLLPQAVLNVKTHKDIRHFILTQCCLEKITEYSGSFTGVVTKYIDIQVSNSEKKDYFIYQNHQQQEKIKISELYKTEHIVFNFLDKKDNEIIEIAKKKGVFNLSQSTWALGIVTGNNKEKLLSFRQPETEVIYTGKEIQAYILKPARNYIKYERQNFQQVAKDEIYRSKEKLVYKFISNKLVFAYDNSGSLFLNSANILIPKIQGMSVKTVMAFLNSEIYQFLYSKMFGEIKILKGNLMQLPFLLLNREENQLLTDLVDNYLTNNNTEILNKINDTIYSLFGFSNQQIAYIKEKLYGTT